MISVTQIVYEAVGFKIHEADELCWRELHMRVGRTKDAKGSGKMPDD